MFQFTCPMCKCSCILLHVTCIVLHFMFHISPAISHVSFHFSHLAFIISCVSCHMPNLSCHMVSCVLLHVAYIVSHAASLSCLYISLILYVRIMTLPSHYDIVRSYQYNTIYIACYNISTTYYSAISIIFYYSTITSESCSRRLLYLHKSCS